MISKASLTLVLLSLLVACGQEQRAGSEAVTGAAGFEQALEAARAAQVQAAEADPDSAPGSAAAPVAVPVAASGAVAAGSFSTSSHR